MLSDSSLERQSHNESQNSTQKFDANTLPERLSISIGGHFGPSFSVELEGALLAYRHSKPVQNFPPEWASGSEELRPSPAQWRAFRAALDQLNVWCWQPEYFEPVCDGTGWSVEIVYSDKAISSRGSNCFPGRTGRPISIVGRTKGDTFEQFCRAVSALVERKFR
jgi:hypothetical protein